MVLAIVQSCNFEVGEFPKRRSLGTYSQDRGEYTTSLPPAATEK